MKSVLGLIICFSDKGDLRELTCHRSTAAVPFGGRYRIVDFILSSMVNSGITDVGMIMRSKYQSLIGHLGSGRDWDLSRKKGGLVLLPPYAFSEKSAPLMDGEHRSKVDALVGSLDLLEDSKCEYVVLADSDIVGNLPLDEIVDSHTESGKKMTSVCIREDQVNPHEVFVKFDDQHIVTGSRLGENGHGEYPYKRLGVYVMRRECLIDMIESCMTRSIKNLEREVFSLIEDQGEMHAYELKNYAMKVVDMDTFYQASLDLLKKEVRDQLFLRDRPILTHVHDENPTYYSENAKVSESIIADGTYVDGTVENSIIFRNVQIGEGAVVKNSIVMTNSVIKEGAYLENMIVDKNVTIRQNKRMMGQRTYPIVIAKDTIV